MNNLNTLQEIARAIRNLIRTGIVTDVDHDEGLCRVQTGGMETTWLNWLTSRAGRSHVWWAPSVGEQVLLLAVGGELDTAFVLPGIFSDNNPAPSPSPYALHVSFLDGAVNLNGNGYTTGLELEVSDVEYESENLEWWIAFNYLLYMAKLAHRKLNEVLAMFHCSKCHFAAHARTSRYFTDTTKERYHQYTNISCSATFVITETVERFIVSPGVVVPVAPHPTQSGQQQITWM
ncbi:DNA-binding transcriptional regulator [Yokenella regensburgei]|uniref:DNA-binding transcriptional regulator n=1 Tax=Yokenella regensburgei TaxID=158877 RepID=UPI0035E3DC49